MRKRQRCPSPRQRAALRLVTFIDQIGQGTPYRMCETWRHGIDIDPGPQIRGAGNGTLPQDSF